MKDDRVYLKHIADAIARIKEYTSGGRAAYDAQSMMRDAVVRNLEVIGEAVKQLSANLRDAHPRIDWSGLAGMRDVLIHQYFGVDHEIVWKVVIEELEPLLKVVRFVLDQGPP